MSSNIKAFIYSPKLDEFPYPATCPFSTLRTGKVKASLESTGLLTGNGKIIVEPQPALRMELEKFHTPRYLDTLYQAGNGEFNSEFLHMGLGTGDCPVFKGVYDNSIWAVGATLTAADLIVSGKANIVFTPSGGLHHAFPEKAGGFCYLNDVVLGIMRLRNAGMKVLFLDIDVHHPDGVQHAFYHQNDVMTISMHENGMFLFPGTGFEDEIGEGDGEGFSVNVPLPPHTYDTVYMKTFYELVVPLINWYKPDVIVVEAGADTLAGDPLAHLNLTNNVMADVLAKVLCFGKPILATGGGGYNVENTVRAWSLVWTVLCEEDNDQDAMAGMGGIMLESTEWHGGQGLRDRVLVVDEKQKQQVDDDINVTINKIKSSIFRLHGIG